MAISVTVISSKTIMSSQQLAKGGGGKTVHIEAVKDGQYLLAASGRQRSPENITVKRVGNNLHVALEGSEPEQPELIIENFFSNPGQLLGIAEDGRYYEYIGTDGDESSGAAFLMADVSSPLALGSQPFVGFADGLVALEKGGFGVLPWLLGGLAVAGGAAAAGGGGGKGNGGATVDTTPPVNHGIGAVVDDKGATQGALGKGDVTDDSRPALSGKGQQPGDKVTITDNGKTIGEAVVDGNGNWTFTPEVDLDDGEQVFEIVVTDPAGNSTGPSDDFVIIIDTTPPINGGIENVVDDEGSLTGSIENGGITDDNRPSLSGKGEPGDVVTIIDNGKVIGEAAVGGDGNWVFTPQDALADGEHVFEVVVTDPAGNSSEPSDDYRLFIDTAPLFKPTIDAVMDDEGELRGQLSSGDVTDDSHPIISGAGKPNSVVLIRDNGVEIGRAAVDSGGLWTFRPTLPLALGGHALSAETVDELGKAPNPSDVFELTIGSQEAPAVPAITSLWDDVGLITGNIQKNGITDDARPTINGTAQAGMTVSIYIDGKLSGTTQVNAQGEWTFTPAADLAEGLHNIAATASNVLGVVSPKTGEYPIIVDTTPPPKPAPDAAVLLDDQAPIVGVIVNGTVTDDNTPSFVGKVEPNAKVIIYDGDRQIGEVSADGDGAWTFTPSPALADGDHALSYIVVDAAGNIGPKSDVITFNVDTSQVTVRIEGADDAVGSYIGPISKGGITDDARPTLYGKATAGGTVKVYEGAKLLGQTVADHDGSWRLQLQQPLAEGEHQLEATVSTHAAGESARSTAFDFTVDTMAPAAPTIDRVMDDVGSVQGALARGDSTDDTTPTLLGKAEAGSTVHLYGNGLLLGSTTADGNGNWSFTASPPLATGAHSFFATSEDPAGNLSDLSAPFDIIVDTMPPPAPMIDSVYDDQGSQTGYLASGDVTDDAKPVLSGRAEANASVVIKDHGVEIGRVLASPDGDWVFEPLLPLLQGDHEFTVEAIDTAGNASLASDSFLLTVGSADMPSEPAIIAVVDDVGLITGNIQKNGVTDDARPSIHGTAQAGMRVSIYIDGVLAGTSKASGTGEWSFTPDADLIDGLHVITATATNSVGNVSAETGGYPIVVDTRAPLQAEASLWDDVGGVIGEIISGTVTDDSTPTFIGRAEPDATVIIYDHGVEIGRAQSNAEGDWQFTPGVPLLDGDHGLSHAVLDPAGNLGPVSEELDFKVDTRAVVISIDGASDDMGIHTGPIAHGGVTDDPTPTLHGRATPGGTVTVYEGTLVLGQTVAASDGSWSFTPANPLTEGSHALTATVSTAANGESVHSAAFDLIVDLTAPTQPTIEQLYDDVGMVQGALPQGQSTDDTTPTLSGKAEAGSVVHVLDNGSLLGRVVADAAGNWSFTPSPPLLNGLHEFSVIAEDKAGNRSAPSDVFAITIDTVPPAAPVITSVYDDQGGWQGNLESGAVTDDGWPTLTGTAEANSTVIIMDGEIMIGTVVADAAGAWSFEPASPLLLGEHRLSAVAIDAAGNRSQPSEEFALVLASGVLPDAPLITAVVDDVGSIQGTVLRDGVTDDAQPSIEGSAQAGMVITVYVDGLPVGSTVADGNGTWCFTPADNLADGVHNITATASNGLGNTSLPSADYPIRVDTTRPEKPGPTDAQLYDDVGQIIGEITNGTVTDDSLPAYKGRTEPHATVVVYDDGQEIGQVSADEAGRWEFVPAAPLLDGEHSFSYRVVDQAGNSGPVSDPVTFAVDTTQVAIVIEGALDDVGTVTGNIAAEGVTDDSTPTLYGTANAGGVVKVYEGSVLLGEVRAGADGKWSFTPPVALSEGWHTLHATVTTVAHGESVASDPFAFSVDLTPPGKPIIDSVIDDVGSVQGEVLDGQYTDDNTPTLVGRADAGSTVNIYDNGDLLGSAIADATGQWRFTPSVPLADGLHAFTARGVDLAGNISPVSNVYSLSVDVSPPGRPTIDSVFDDQGDMQGTLASGATTDDAKPVLSGKAEANATIIVYDQGVEIGRAHADASGRWSHEPGLPLLQGGHSFTIVAVDAAGNVGPVSNAFALTVLTDARPSSPAILGVLDDVGSITGIIQKNGVTDDVRPTVYGTAQSGSIVSVYVDDVLLGTTMADSRGSWSFTSSVDFPDGLHYFNVTSSNGSQVSAKTGNYPVLFDSTPPPNPGAEDAALWDLVGESISVISNGTVTDDKSPAFVGKTEPNATIIIYDAGTEIGRAQSNAAGSWMFSPMPVLLDGPHQLSYAVMDKAGNISAKSPVISFTVDTSTLSVIIEGAVDDVGSIQGAITDGGTTDDARPTFHGKATPGGIVTLFDGALVIGQAVAGTDGSWRFTVETPFAHGLHNVTAKVFTEAGGQSAASPTFYVTVDTRPPAKPSIEQIVDDVGAQQGWLNDGQSSDDGTPTLAGRAEAGNTVRIYDNNSLLGSVVADADGVWSFTPTTLLNNGKHVFTVISADEAGNVSVASDPYTVIVDTIVAAAPSIDSAYDDQGAMQGTLASGANTDDAKPVLSGRGEAFATIIVRDNGVEIGRAVVGANGRWSFEPSLPLVQGAHAFTAVALDAAGNVSETSKPFSLQVFIENPPDTAAITAVIDDVGSVIGAVQKHGVTNDARPTISGTAPLGMTVSIYIDDILVGTTMADGRGYWSFRPGNALADGLHYISAVSADGLGGVTAKTGSYPIIVDTVSPTKPVPGDAQLWSDVGQLIGEIGNGGQTDDATPLFKGRAIAGATIVIQDKGREIGRAAVDEVGNWSYTPYPALADGQHRFTYAVVDAAGNASPVSDEIVFVIDTMLRAVRIDGANDDVGSMQGGFATGSAIDDPTPSLFGRATVGGVVKIYEGSMLLGSAEVAIDGSWRFTPTPGFAEGVHNLHATVTLAGGQESGPSALFSFTVDTTAPQQPSIDTLSNDVGKLQGVLADGQVSDDTTPTLAGRAEAGSTVSIFGNGGLLGTALVGADGRWNFTPTTPLINGEHQFTVTAMDRAGNVSAASVPYAMVVDTIAPERPTIDAAYDDQGAMQGTLASGDETDDQMPVFNGKAEAGCSVVIRDNGVEIGRVVADANGRWSFAVSEPLGLGLHNFTLTAVDMAGNSSVPSAGFDLMIMLDASVDPLLTLLPLSAMPEMWGPSRLMHEDVAHLQTYDVLADAPVCVLCPLDVLGNMPGQASAGASSASLQSYETADALPAWTSAAPGSSYAGDCTASAVMAEANVRVDDMHRLQVM